MSKNNNSADFLFELGCEELPPKALLPLSNALQAAVAAGLSDAELAYGEFKSYAAPRRLGFYIKQLQLQQADKTQQRRGPALAAAYDKDGKPSKAAQGFAKSCGLDDVSQLQTLQSDKGEWLVYDMHLPGRQAQQLMPEIIDKALEQLPIPKRMRWGAGQSQFVRPVHWLLMLLGEQVVDAEILSVKSGRLSYGHRFHAPQPITIDRPAHYQSLLQDKGRVIADFEARKANIRQQVQDIANQVKGRAVIDEDLLNEVCSMVEWPVALIGNFEARFLEVPAEVLITTMKENQKYFYVVDNKHRLMPHFITVANLQSKQPDAVRQGNERVVRPRLVDAEFFWNQDRKQPLISFAERLKNVVFQVKLGSLYDKCCRVENLGVVIGHQLQGDDKLIARAAKLSKCDLMSDMVGEFPNLQGCMGRYYALASGEEAEVALALEQQYQPRFAGDAIPASLTGQALAIADKLDSLCGIFAIGQIPSGDKDPFALRRAALGVLRTIIEAKLELNLLELIEQALHNYAGRVEIKALGETANQVMTFMMERLRAYYQDQNIAPEVFESVLERRVNSPYDFDRRIKAVNQFTSMAEAESLASANKRIANILKKAGGEYSSREVDNSLLKEKAEKQLAKELLAMEKQVSPEIGRQHYEKALARMAGLRASVDAFFDSVMVMCDDQALRDNRLCLLSQLRALFLRVADISALHISKD